MDEDEAPVSDRLFPVRSLERVEYMVDRIRNDLPVDGPLSPDLCLIGQRMIDTALASARSKRTQLLLA